MNTLHYRGLTIYLIVWYIAHSISNTLKTENSFREILSKRNLILGMVGMALLLIGMLVYAQVNASHNYDLGNVQQVD